MEENKGNGTVIYKEDILDGLFYKNTVFISGLVIAPVVVAANTVQNALGLISIFSVMTFVTVMISSFFPRNLVYAARIILYTLVGAIVYVPINIILQRFFPEIISGLGIFIPLLITNSLIVFKTETRFFRKSKIRMTVDILSYILGFDAAVMIFAFVREIISNGAIGEKILGVPMTFPALSLPFGGFILLGLFCALYRKITSPARRNR